MISGIFATCAIRRLVSYIAEDVVRKKRRGPKFRANLRRVVNYFDHFSTNWQLSFDGGGSWVDAGRSDNKLFLDMLLVNGIARPSSYVTVKPSSGRGFLVKNWQFTSRGRSGDPSFPYINIPPQRLSNGRYFAGYHEVVDAMGVLGQGPRNPLAEFANHQIAFIDGIYYDPSYSLTYSSISTSEDPYSMEETAIAGFYTERSRENNAPIRVFESRLGIDMDRDGQFTGFFDVDAFLIRPNDASAATTLRALYSDWGNRNMRLGSSSRVGGKGRQPERLGMPAKLVRSLDRDTLAVALDFMRPGTVEEIGRQPDVSDQVELGQLGLQTAGTRAARIGAQLYQHGWHWTTVYKLRAQNAQTGVR